MRKPTKNWIDRRCLVCESDFKVSPWRIKKGGGLYCSIHCLNVRNGRKYAENCNGENNANWKGGLTNNRYAYKLKDKQRHPVEHKAREAVKRAKKSGKIIPQPCFVCGEIKVHAHHEDYLKPLDVKWLCSPCHRAQHN